MRPWRYSIMRLGAIRPTLGVWINISGACLHVFTISHAYYQQWTPLFGCRGSRGAGGLGQYLGGWQAGGRASGDRGQGQFSGMGNVCWEERQLLPRVQDAENGMPLALVVKTIRRAALCVPCRLPFLRVEFALQFYSYTICVFLLNLAFFLFFGVLF